MEFPLGVSEGRAWLRVVRAPEKVPVGGVCCFHPLRECQKQPTRGGYLGVTATVAPLESITLEDNYV